MTSINIVVLPKKYSQWAKSEVYDINQYSCSPEKVFPYELELFWSLLSPIHGHTYSKCIFTIQGVPKMKNAKKWAKVEINDFN